MVDGVLLHGEEGFGGIERPEAPGALRAHTGEAGGQAAGEQEAIVHQGGVDGIVLAVPLEQVGDQRMPAVEEAELRRHPIRLVPRGIPGDRGISAEAERRRGDVVYVLLDDDLDEDDDHGVARRLEDPFVGPVRVLPLDLAGQAVVLAQEEGVDHGDLRRIVGAIPAEGEDVGAKVRIGELLDAERFVERLELGLHRAVGREQKGRVLLAGDDL